MKLKGIKMSVVFALVLTLPLNVWSEISVEPLDSEVLTEIDVCEPDLKEGPGIATLRTRRGKVYRERRPQPKNLPRRGRGLHSSPTDRLGHRQYYGSPCTPNEIECSPGWVAVPVSESIRSESEECTVTYACCTLLGDDSEEVSAPGPWDEKM